MEAVVARLERVADRLERLEGGHAGAAAVAPAQAPALTASPVPAPAAAAPTSSAIAAWSKLMASSVEPFVKLSGELGPEISTASHSFQRAFQAVGRVLQTSSTAQKPDAAGLQQLLAPVSECMMALGKAAEGRRGDGFNHVKALVESVQSLSWMAYTGPACGLAPPAEFVSSSWHGAEFWTNKILVEFRGKDDRHVQWTKALKDAMAQQIDVVGKHFAQGLVWNAQGVPLSQAMAAPAPAAAAVPAPAPPPPPAPAPPRAKPSGGGPPPPPPPPPGPPPPPLSIDKIQGGASGSRPSKAGGGQPDMAALFADISKGEAVTAGLKKVTADMKTNNRTDRTGVVSLPEKVAPKHGAAGARGGLPSGTPRLENTDRKWMVEYQTGVVFSDVIASCEVVNCKSVQLQTTGVVPNLSVEKTDGVQIYVTRALTQNPSFQIVTAKCSEMNVIVLGGNNEDPVEEPIPEQFVTTFVDGKPVTVAAAHSGA